MKELEIQMLPDGSLRIGDTIIRQDQKEVIDRINCLTMGMLFELDLEKRAYLHYGLVTDREGWA
jgi:hypothetical protein